MAGLQTEFDFTLPKGFVDEVGVVHRTGTMRLATARDEIEPLRSNEIDGPDDPYLTVLVLARVLTELGSLTDITSQTVEQLFAADLAFLQDLYGIINFGDVADVAALQSSVPEPEQAPPIGSEPAVDVDREANDADPTVMAKSSSMRSRGYVEEVEPTSS